MIKCIIFDCDGTLVDSEHLFNRALSQKLGERSIDVSADQLVTRFRGAKLAFVLETLSCEFKVELGDNFVQEYRELAEQFFKQELQACDGVMETLPQIKLAMCVASNGPLAKMQLALNVTNLASYFGDNLFSAYDVGSWKPEPGLFLHAANAMGFAPQECLVVEDSVVGIQAAKAADMNALLYDPNNIHASVGEVIRIQRFGEVLNSLN